MTHRLPLFFFHSFREILQRLAEHSGSLDRFFAEQTQMLLCFNRLIDGQQATNTLLRSLSEAENMKREKATLALQNLVRTSNILSDLVSITSNQRNVVRYHTSTQTGPYSDDGQEEGADGEDGEEDNGADGAESKGEGEEEEEDNGLSAVARGKRRMEE